MVTPVVVGSSEAEDIAGGELQGGGKLREQDGFGATVVPDQN